MRTSPDYGEAPIEDLLASELPLRHVRPTGQGYTNEMYAAELEGQEVFVRVDRRGRGTATERSVMAAYAAQGVPVPSVLHTGVLEALGREFLVLGRVPGTQLSEAALALDETALAFAAAGSTLRRIHGIRVAGDYGLAVLRGGEIRGTDAEWRTSVEKRRTMRQPAALAVAGYVDVADAARIHASYDRVAAAAPDPVLLHGDFHAQHVFTQDGTVTGVIDFDRATVGDPRFDLGHTRSMLTAAQWTAFAQGYGPDAEDPLVNDWHLVIVAGKVIWGLQDERAEVLAHSVPRLIRLLRGPLPV